MLPLSFPVAVLAFVLFTPTATALPAGFPVTRNIPPLQLILQRPYYCDMNGPPGVKLEECSVSAEFCCPHGTTCWSGNGTEIMCALETRQIYPGEKCDATPLAPYATCGDGLCCGPYMTCSPGRGCVPDGVIPGGMASLENPVCNTTRSEFQCGVACCSADRGEVCNTRTGTCEALGTTVIPESLPAPSRLPAQPVLDPNTASATPLSAGGHPLPPAQTFPSATGASFNTGPGLPPPPLAERELLAASSSTSNGEPSASETAHSKSTFSSSPPPATRAQNAGVATPMTLALAASAGSDPQDTRTSQQVLAVPTIGWVAPMDDNSASVAARPMGNFEAIAVAGALIFAAVHV